MAPTFECGCTLINVSYFVFPHRSSNASPFPFAHIRRALFLIKASGPELTQHTTKSNHRHHLSWDPINNSACCPTNHRSSGYFGSGPHSPLSSACIAMEIFTSRPITRWKWQLQANNPQLVCNTSSPEARGLAEVVYFVDRHLECRRTQRRDLKRATVQ